MRRTYLAIASILCLLLIPAAMQLACERGEDGYEDQQDRRTDQIECVQACELIEQCGLLEPDYLDLDDCRADCLSDEPRFDRECVFAAQDCEARDNCFFEDED
ncbi:MAG: hypothetical protein P9M14_09310 [Candidatus Alcyoniella australis]|nr:hypothetical protein [Candidatus Alcyoniella australis]